MTKEELKKLREHCEKQVALSYALGDIKHASEHELVLELIDKVNEQDQIIREAKEYVKRHRRIYDIDGSIEKQIDEFDILASPKRLLEILDRNVNNE